MFLLWHFELIERCVERIDAFLPVGFVDAEAGVDGLHVAAEIKARAARRVTEKIDEMLTKLLL